MSVTIYKVFQKGFYIHANKVTISGFSIASPPFVYLDSKLNDEGKIIDVILSILETEDDKTVPNPVDWTEFNRLFLRNMGVKSNSILTKSNVKCLVGVKQEGQIVFKPTKHASVLSKGYLHKGENDFIRVMASENKDVMMSAFELALSKCE